jgi:hypothetical protein
MKQIVVDYPDSPVFHNQRGTVIAAVPTGYDCPLRSTWYLVSFQNPLLKPYSFMKIHLKEIQDVNSNF